MRMRRVWFEHGVKYPCLTLAYCAKCPMRKHRRAPNVRVMTNTQHETEQITPVEAWDAIATAYDQYVTAGESDVAEAGLRLAGLRPGDSFLDIAAGTGGLSLPAARLGAKVLATDWSPSMVEMFNARAAAEKLDAAARVMECHALDLPDSAFDVTGSQFGVMLVPDQARALREMVRVTRPNGRVVLIAYGDPARFEVLHAFVAAAQVVVPGFEGPSEDKPLLEFQVADPDVMKQRLTQAGLTDVVVNIDHEERVEVRSGQQLWDWTLGGNPVPGMLVADLSEDQRADIVKVLNGMVRERADLTGTAVFTAPLNIGVGTA
jgi:ubiquinone/menaquinone biosynthesis C-methylase UbiE